MNENSSSWNVMLKVNIMGFFEKCMAQFCVSIFIQLESGILWQLRFMAAFLSTKKHDTNICYTETIA